VVKGAVGAGTGVPVIIDDGPIAVGVVEVDKGAQPPKVRTLPISDIIMNIRNNLPNSTPVSLSILKKSWISGDYDCQHLYHFHYIHSF
jgi:hypothetical protein